MRDWRRLPLSIACLVIAACGAGSEQGEPVGDPAEAIVGKWVYTNEVGEMSYSFTADGRFRSRVANKYQSFTSGGGYSLNGDRVLLYEDEAEDGPEELRFLDRRRLVQAGSDIEVIYVLQE